MGRKSSNKRKNEFPSQDGRKLLKMTLEVSQDLDNEYLFKEYYRIQFEQPYFSKDKNEFDLFWSQMHKELPVVIRLCSFSPNSKKILPDLSNNENSLKQEIEQLNDKSMCIKKFQLGEENIQVKQLEYFQKQEIWQIGCSRDSLKRQQSHFKIIHERIQKAADAGLLVRQELVSMIPPLILSPSPSDIVLDMCAAPGSKTLQLLEMISYGKGAVIANDIDEKRAYILAHQCAKLSSSGLVVVSHPAQQFPQFLKSDLIQNQTFYYDKKMYFDKVLADVPCSGDGATRKIPEMWRKWSTVDAINLHPLQIDILQRALQLCKVGGLVAYSTCSLNPIENEAVVTEIFRRANAGSVELLDIEQSFPKLKFRSGLSEWKVCVEEKQTNCQELKSNSFFKMREIESHRSLGEEEISQNSISCSMFPETQNSMEKIIQIQKSVRILPHDQDTGGFYIALLKKKSLIAWGGGNQIQEAAKHQMKQNKSSELFGEKYIQNNEKRSQKQTKQNLSNNDELNIENNQFESAMKKQQQLTLKAIIQTENDSLISLESKESANQQKMQSKFDQFVRISDQDWQNIQDHYALIEIDSSLLISSTIGNQRTLRLITPATRSFCDLDKAGQLKYVTIGTRAFERTKNVQDSNKLSFRLCQEAANILTPHLTKRKIKVTEEEFKFFITHPTTKLSSLPSNDLSQQIFSLGYGSILIHCESFSDSIVLQNSLSSLDLSANRELLDSLQMRYFKGDIFKVLSE